VRVGGDPARIKVDGTLEQLIRSHGLPIDWLTVRTNTRKDGFEGGEIVLRPGRGGYVAWDDADGRTFNLVPNKVDAGFLRSWADGEAGRLDRIAALFARLSEAIDGCYGIATLLPRRRAMPPTDVGLGDVGWLNYFGPAFVQRFPRLAEDVTDSTHLPNGGVVIRIAPTPWELDDAARRPVVEAIGEDAFVRSWGPGVARGISVPSYEDHMRHSPGSMEMPWVRGEIERDAARAERTRERRYARSRRKREAALVDRRDPGPAPRDAEWSTSFDADDWRSFAPRLFRRLGGELAGPVAKPLIEEIASAPLNHEESVVLLSDLGAIEVHWFIDDIDTVDIYFFGPAALPPLIDVEHARWSEG
jgi:hypothetical protein